MIGRANAPMASRSASDVFEIDHGPRLPGVEGDRASRPRRDRAGRSDRHRCGSTQQQEEFGQSI